MPLLHGPHADDDPTADAEHPAELPESLDAPLGGRDVVDHRDAQHRVQTLVAEREAQVITVEYLERKLAT